MPFVPRSPSPRIREPSVTTITSTSSSSQLYIMLAMCPRSIPEKYMPRVWAKFEPNFWQTAPGRHKHAAGGGQRLGSGWAARGCFRTDGWSVHDGREFVDVILQDSVVEHLVPVLQSLQDDILLQRVRLRTDLQHDLLALLRHAQAARRHEPAERHAVALGVLERGSLVQQRLFEQRAAVLRRHYRRLKLARALLLVLEPGQLFLVPFDCFLSRLDAAVAAVRCVTSRRRRSKERRCAQEGRLREAADDRVDTPPHISSI